MSSFSPEDRRESVLMDAGALRARLESGLPTVVLAVRGADSVAPLPLESHPRLPGAHDAGLAEDFSSPSHPLHGSRPLPDPQDLQAAVRRWGIHDGDLVVVYDHDGGLLAARGWWVLRWAGLDVRLLDGGFQAWLEAGGAVDHAPPVASPPGTAVVQPGHLPQFGPDQALVLGRHGVLLDSRMHANYVGAPTAAGEPRRGHIPGAWSIPAAANLAPDGRFAGVDQLRDLYAPTGALDGGEVGVYCGAGVSAAHDVLALALLGVDAAMYPGSWSAWIGSDDRPAVIGQERG